MTHCPTRLSLLSSLPSRVASLCGVALLLGACSHQDSQGAGSAKAQAAPPPPPVSVIEMRPQRIPIVLETIGQTEGSKAVEVRARVGGILEKRLYQEGDPVKAGVAMFQIERAPYEHALDQARAQVAQDQARIDQYRRDVDRLRPLAQDRAVSQKEYDDARSNLQLAEASLQQSQARLKDAQLNLSYTVVTAPVSGVTGRAEKTEGNLITTDANGSLLTTINQLDPMWVSFAFGQSDLAKLPGGRIDPRAGSAVTLLRPDGTTYPQRGRINFAATQIDLKQGTQQMRAAFSNPSQQLMPGEFVRVRVEAGDRDNVFLVPQAAVVQTEKNYLVFVVEDGKVAARPVTTGDWYGTNWIITSGLKA
ncbi:MAG TPA: efflux RND transporter periplasmic adaptor subunit, partial [Casimicrobiaceae bacterium]|nr:efflux RND transporter periplasmic adaptor subunit [Casimicrobiaceae bacterium]